MYCNKNKHSIACAQFIDKLEVCTLVSRWKLRSQFYCLTLTVSLSSRSVVSDSMRPHGLLRARPPCPSPSLGTCSGFCPLNQWYHPTISSFAFPFYSCLLSFPASGSFPLRQMAKVTGLQPASVLLMNIQGWFPLGLTGLNSLQSKGLSRVFSNNTVEKHQFFGAQPSLGSNSHIHTWLLKKT